MSAMDLSGRIRVRWPYLIMYVLLATSGVIVLVAPSIGATESVRELLAHVWAYFFIAGGLLSAYGLVRGVLWGEATGLPMAGSATLVYGIILIERFTVTRSVGAIIVGLLFCAYAFGLIGRWIEVMQILRIARHVE